MKTMNFTHIDTEGAAVMVDVGGKAATQREAAAAGGIRMSAECFAAVRDGGAKKGDVLGVARVAGIMAAKRVPELIPLCHNLSLTSVKIEFTLRHEACEITAVCTAKCEGKTGVEMEALTGVTVALLTVYDMCKALDKRMEINGVHLIEKTGGKSGHFLYDRKVNGA